MCFSQTFSKCDVLQEIFILKMTANKLGNKTAYFVVINNKGIVRYNVGYLFLIYCKPINGLFIES